MRHCGLGQSFGSLQIQSHLGCSQTLWHGCMPGQVRSHRGSLHSVWHSAHSRPAQSRFGQRTVHTGCSHLILQLEVSAAPQRVSHRGASHEGSQIWSHMGISHFHVHFGTQPPPGRAGCGGGVHVASMVPPTAASPARYEERPLEPPAAARMDGLASAHSAAGWARASRLPARAETTSAVNVMRRQLRSPGMAATGLSQAAGIIFASPGSCYVARGGLRRWGPGGRALSKAARAP
mmetsp:Transcript_99157/g.319721  ORF Transcript_99157/g.319721 Transcript_99157/m.319721 type:complete len:235 (+) Transcript_99157:404-1108(+)